MDSYKHKVGKKREFDMLMGKLEKKYGNCNYSSSEDCKCKKESSSSSSSSDETESKKHHHKHHHNKHHHKHCRGATGATGPAGATGATGSAGTGVGKKFSQFFIPTATSTSILTPSWIRMIGLVYAGSTTVDVPVSVHALVNGNGNIRIQDITNAQTVATATFNSPGPLWTPIVMGSLTNVSNTEVQWEIQANSISGTVNVSSIEFRYF